MSADDKPRGDGRPVALRALRSARADRAGLFSPTHRAAHPRRPQAGGRALLPHLRRPHLPAHHAGHGASRLVGRALGAGHARRAAPERGALPARALPPAARPERPARSRSRPVPLAPLRHRALGRGRVERPASRARGRRGRRVPDPRPDALRHAVLGGAGGTARAGRAAHRDLRRPRYARGDTRRRRHQGPDPDPGAQLVGAPARGGHGRARRGPRDRVHGSGHRYVRPRRRRAAPARTLRALAGDRHGDRDAGHAPGLVGRHRAHGGRHAGRAGRGRDRMVPDPARAPPRALAGGRRRVVGRLRRRHAPTADSAAGHRAGRLAAADRAPRGDHARGHALPRPLPAHPARRHRARGLSALGGGAALARAQERLPDRDRRPLHPRRRVQHLHADDHPLGDGRLPQRSEAEDPR